MKNKKGKLKRGGARKTFKWILLVFAACILAFLIFFAVKILSLDAWHEFEPEKITNTAQTLIIYDANQVEAARFHDAEDRIDISLESLPQHVINAFISAEDARFFEHIGVDFIRILGAAWEDIKAGSYVQGASTISQQLIKLTHLDARKTMTRKLEEAVLAYQMEQIFSKNQILEMYLNYVYFGRGYYGIEAAAQGYFGKPADRLTVSEAAMLAGILKSPTNYAPHLDYEASIGRRNNIISLMCEYGYISETEKTQYRAEVPIIIDKDETENRNYYIDYAMTSTCKLLQIDMDTLLTGEYRIYTALNDELQNYCQSMFDDETLFPQSDCQGALAVTDTKSGLVIAMLGGRGNYSAFAFNRATDMRRQPGSVIKPIISYAPALESKKYNAATMILDEKTTFADYAPRNTANKYNGWVTLRYAIKKSLNIPAVKVLNDIGVDTGIEFAKKCGINFESDDRNLALALGGFKYGVAPMEIAGAYTAFAAGGIFRPPEVIDKITDKAGNVLYARDETGTRVMSEENAYILSDMLKSAIAEGTGHRLGELNMPLAGKTGTVGDSTGNRDAWMAAYSTDYAAAVWVGYDTSKDGDALPADSGGGKYPALILKKLFSYLYYNDTPDDFLQPAGVEKVKLDTKTMDTEHRIVRASALTPSQYQFEEVFARGSAPEAESEYWVVPVPAQNFRLSLSGAAPAISFKTRQAFVQYKLFREDSFGGIEFIKKWSNSANVTLQYTDNTAEPGETYRYFVVPAHSELKINGKQINGPTTAKLEITVPEYTSLPNDSSSEIIVQRATGSNG